MGEIVFWASGKIRCAVSFSRLPGEDQECYKQKISEQIQEQLMTV